MASTVVTSIVSGRKVLSDAEFLYLTPWTNESTIGSTTYDLTDIVADTISIEQDDNDVNSIESEFVDVPLFENIDLGKINVAATCIDLQNTVMQAIYGWTVKNTGVFAPTSYTHLYATIAIGFKNAVLVAPKVRLDSKPVFASLKTGSAEAQISGTCYNSYVAFKSPTAAGTQATFAKADYQLAPLALLPLATVSAGGSNKTSEDTFKDNVSVVATLPAE